MRRFFPQRNSISLPIRDRKGTILVWFAVFLFALFPLAALIVDFGLVTLTRRQMQTAVTTAALEGLRFRDALPPEWIDHPPNGLAAACPEEDLTTKEGCDCARRWAASNLVENLFDDDLSPGQDPMQFGAGPLLELTGGTQLEGTDFYVNPLITSPQPPVYKPQLQLNLDNVPEGDMVAGQWQETIPPDHSEDEDYIRGDFASKPDGRYDLDAPNDAFLVRLRRTNPQRGESLLIDNTSKTSSSEWTLPALFGRGGITRAVHNPDPAALWNQREYGTPVRATAIAQAQPAMAVGVGDPARSIRGLAPVGISSTFWETLSVGVETPVFSASFINHLNVASFGNSMPASTDPLSDQNEEMYLPLYFELDREGAITQRMTGFGFARVRIENGDVWITRQASRIAPANATSIWFNPPSDLSSEELGILLRERDRIQSSLLLAPALRRTVQ